MSRRDPHAERRVDGIEHIARGRKLLGQVMGRCRLFCAPWPGQTSSAHHRTTALAPGEAGAQMRTAARRPRT